MLVKGGPGWPLPRNVWEYKEHAYPYKWDEQIGLEFYTKARFLFMTEPDISQSMREDVTHVKPFHAC